MLHFICALKCEALPLLRHFGLQHHGSADLFSCYLNESSAMSLTITGVGAVNAAAGTMHAIHRFQARQHHAWLNVGIAGHKNLPLGSARLANRIEDAAGTALWFPQILLSSPVPSCGLTSMAAPASSYGDAMIDMEAAGFYASASRAGTAELIHCLKIISDNEQSPARGVAARQVSALIAGQLGVIENIAGQLRDLSARLPVSVQQPDHLSRFTERWHFTAYQRHRLTQLLNRWNVLLPACDPLLTLPPLKRGAEVLVELEQNLDEAALAAAPERQVVPATGTDN